METVRKGGNKVKTHDVEWKRSGKKVEINAYTGVEKKWKRSEKR